mmetsp:Transcript_25752/g.77595  ORF Transcript_25752/g.77595 Transcript_25752/m.77595 type:complete len:123 (+) Transcript_25752:95-463(+)
MTPANDKSETDVEAAPLIASSVPNKLKSSAKAVGALLLMVGVALWALVATATANSKESMEFPFDDCDCKASTVSKRCVNVCSRDFTQAAHNETVSTATSATATSATASSRGGINLALGCTVM